MIRQAGSCDNHVTIAKCRETAVREIIDKPPLKYRSIVIEAEDVSNDHNNCVTGGVVSYRLQAAVGLLAIPNAVVGQRPRLLKKLWTHL